MRRQLKLQGQLSRPQPSPDQEASQAASGPLRLQADGTDGEPSERQRAPESRHRRAGAGAGAGACAASAHVPPAEGPSSEELRCSSIAALRAKAREHEAEIHNTINASGGGAQTQEAGARRED